MEWEVKKAKKKEHFMKNKTSPTVFRQSFLNFPILFLTE